jgi:hypothetical protein
MSPRRRRQRKSRDLVKGSDLRNELLGRKGREREREKRLKGRVARPRSMLLRVD